MVLELKIKTGNGDGVGKKKGNKHCAAKRGEKISGSRDGSAENGNQQGTATARGTEIETGRRDEETQEIGNGPSGTVAAQGRNVKNGNGAIRNGDGAKKKREESGEEQ